MLSCQLTECCLLVLLWLLLRSRPDNMDMGRYTEGMKESEFLDFFK